MSFICDKENGNTKNKKSGSRVIVVRLQKLFINANMIIDEVSIY